MEPARTTTTAGASPRLVARHADGGGALPQLWHPSRCHGASGPGRSPSGLQGPALRGLSGALPGPGRGGPRCAAPRAPGRAGCLVAVGPGLGVWTPASPGRARPPSASPGQPFLPVALSNSASRARLPPPSRWSSVPPKTRWRVLERSDMSFLS